MDAGASPASLAFEHRAAWHLNLGVRPQFRYRLILSDNDNAGWCCEVAADINQRLKVEDERDGSMVIRQRYPADDSRLNQS